MATEKEIRGYADMTKYIVIPQQKVIDMMAGQSEYDPTDSDHTLRLAQPVYIVGGNADASSSTKVLSSTSHSAPTSFIPLSELLTLNAGTTMVRLSVNDIDHGILITYDAENQPIRSDMTGGPHGELLLPGGTLEISPIDVDTIKIISYTENGSSVCVTQFGYPVV